MLPLKLNNILIYALLLGCLPTKGQAQNYVHFTSWNKIAIGKEFSEAFELSGEFNYKRQNNYHSNLESPLANAYSEDLKLWLNFKKNDWMLVVSPFTHLYNMPLLGKESDFSAKGAEEWRFALGLEYRPSFEKWGYKLRATYEYRLLESHQYSPTGRLRLRVGANYNFTEKTRLVLQNDLFFNTSPSPATNFYDNDWASIGINHAFSDHLNMELGYLRATKERSTQTEFDLENAINLAIIIHL